MFIAELFTIDKSEQHKCPKMDRIDKQDVVYTDTYNGIRVSLTLKKKKKY